MERIYIEQSKALEALCRYCRLECKVKNVPQDRLSVYRCEQWYAIMQIGQNMGITYMEDSDIDSRRID